MPESWLPNLSRADGAKYLAIAEALSSAIQRGDLQHGERIAPQREVAARLGVDLTTVTKAYEAVRARGLIAPRGRAGSFVIHPEKSRAQDRGQLDTSMNMPPELPGDILTRAIAEGTSTLLSAAGAELLHYQPAGGAAQERAAAAAFLTSNGLPSTEEDVILAAGGQNALFAIFSAVLKPGDGVACGTYVYPGMRAIAARLGLRLVPLPVLNADALEQACQSGEVDALYLVPTNDNPTAATLSADDRKAIATVANRHDLLIVEDDAYGPLALNRIAPTASFAPGRSWYISSISKLISPALRTAYVRAPNISAAINIANDVHETAVMAPPLNAALLTHWMSNRTFPKLLDAMRKESAARLQCAHAALDGVAFQYHPNGYHLWLPLPEGRSANAVIAAMRTTGLSLVSSDQFALRPDAPQALRVSLGGLIDRAQLTRALRLLHSHLAARADRPATIV